MRGHFAPGGTQTDHPYADMFNAARKVVFSRTTLSDGILSLEYRRHR